MALSTRSSPEVPAPLAEINTTPLVDIMLVLFVIFLVTAPLLTHTVPLDLPKEQGAPEQPDTKHHSLAIDAKGNYYFDDAPLQVDGIEPLFARLATQDDEAPVDLRIDEKAEYRHISRILAAAQRAGLSQVAFVMESR
ncbi:biopolymer transporter ExbD [Hahella sp. SMD15-11]|uniref:Biopolymer transporter ExbD n=1 Tax=Thermohahella caldifontis TaxID=3142973 RepID=A0AB39UWW0_9GAMM